MNYKFKHKRANKSLTDADPLLSGSPSWKTGKFCKILYVIKHFLNDFGWLILNFTCLNFVCCCEVFQVSSKHFIKLGGIFSLLPKLGRRKIIKVLQVFGCSLIKFTSDRQIYNFAAHYNKNKADYVSVSPRRVSSWQIIAERSKRVGNYNYDQLWSSIDWANRGARNFTFSKITLTSWTNFCCCCENIQNTCMLNPWFFLIFKKRGMWPAPSTDKDILTPNEKLKTLNTTNQTHN